MVLSRFSSLAVFTALATASTSAAAAPIHQDVHRALQQNDGNANVVIVFKKDTLDSLNSYEEDSSASRADRIDSMLNHLQEENNMLQKDVFDILGEATLNDDKPLVGKIHNFTITSNLYVNAASADFIQRVAQLPNVQEVRAPEVIPLSKPIAVESRFRPNEGLEWGVKKINAPQVWEKGNHGEGILIGQIDSGVRYTHSAVRDSFIGEYGWYDPERQSETPYDNNGHGTHTMGTMVGQNGIGVAPGAKWMACKGCRDRECPEEDLMKCFEFMTCPTDTQGNNRDCKKTPHVINNSWGGSGGSPDSYKDAVDAWLRAGIIPVFANGNEGPSCSSVGSPGDLATVIGVGATTINDGIADFSSKGPTSSGLMKPDISAPGHEVRSSVNTGDNDFASFSGTSMATPHVTASIALLLNAKPGTSFADIKKLLFGSVVTETLKGDGMSCGGIAENKYPNNAFGHGRLDIYNAIYGNANPGPVPSRTSTPAPTRTRTRTPAPTEEPTVAPTNAPTENPSDDRCAGYHNPISCEQAGCYWSTWSESCWSD